MINKFFAKLTVLITALLLTGCAAALGSAVSSALLDEVTKGVVNNVLTPEQSVKTATQEQQNTTSVEIKPVVNENNQTTVASSNTTPQCQHVDQSVNLPNGQIVHEKRIACLDEKTGDWRLVQ